jgi:hypothetical protein
MNKPSFVPRSFKFYPDLMAPRLGYILADTAVLLWVALWLYIGDFVYNAVITLQSIGKGLVANGNNVNSAVTRLQNDVATLPLVGSNLRDAFNALHGPPGALIQTGNDELQAVAHLATTLGVVVAAIPILIALLNFIPWRVRRTRGFRNLDYMLRQPGAGAVSTTMQVLAGRAIYTLPYDRLLDYSSDPIREWREGRYYNLARATMAEEGLDVRRYLRRVEGLTPLPEPRPHKHPHNLPTIGDD